jgi:hypothetical protein
VAAVALAATAWLLAGPSRAGDKAAVWKSFLPADAYTELVGRAAKNIEEALAGKPDEDAIKKAQFNAVMIAAYTLSAKEGGKDPAGVRAAALGLAKLAGAKGKLGEARKLAAALAAGMIPPGAPKAEPPADWKPYLENRADLMEHMKTKMKGGDGIHPTLQSNIRLKGTQNGIEEKVRALAMKQLMPAGAAKEADELALLGYRAAVLGEVTYFYLPKKNVKEWHELALEMRDAGIALAEAAKKKDTEAILKAANSLNSSCNRCHSEFRGKT